MVASVAEERALARREQVLMREIACHDLRRLLDDHPDRMDEAEELIDQIRQIDLTLRAMSRADDIAREASA